MRSQLLRLVKQVHGLAERHENKRGILCTDAPISMAADLYVGEMYQTLRHELNSVLRGDYSNVNVLIVSAFYGLVQLREGLKEYDLQMGDELADETKVYQFWQEQALWRLLREYISEKRVSHVWSLLPNSLQAPYHRVFRFYWNHMNKQEIKRFHVKVFKEDGLSAGSGSGEKRAEWLREILRANPDYLTGHPTLPPPRITSISGFRFGFETC